MELSSTSCSSYSHITLEKLCCSGEGTKRVPSVNPPPGRTGTAWAELWGTAGKQWGSPSKHQHTCQVFISAS